MSPDLLGNPLVLTGDALGIFDVEHVARHARPVRIGHQAHSRLAASFSSLQGAITGDNPIYGVNTGFGSFARRRVGLEELTIVQRNLLRSHSAGVGEPLREDLVRAMLLLLAASLCRGHSGVRPLVATHIIDLLNHSITPIVPSIGSVGASGDLAPLAHACLSLIGEGEVLYQGAKRPSGDVLKEVGIEPLKLGPKEGLALINGTHLMSGEAALIMADVERVFDAATVAAAMSIDACRATDAFLDDRAYAIRNHDGPRRVASLIRSHLAGSEILPSHRVNDPRVQDPYSFRCCAYVIGAALDLLGYIKGRVERELGAVTDNPLIFEENPEYPSSVISAGNFHGAPIAIPLDCIPLALAHIAGIAERRIYYLLAATDPENKLHPHLSPHPGVESGYMITQYTAAACCNELITLSTPASVSNLPTCAGVEDYNSFGPRAAAMARRAVELCRSVVAIELLCSSEAIEYQRPLRSGDGVERAHATIREVVSRLDCDRSPAPDILAIEQQIRMGRFR